MLAPSPPSVKILTRSQKSIGECGIGWMSSGLGLLVFYKSKCSSVKFFILYLYRLTRQVDYYIAFVDIKTKVLSQHILLMLKRKFQFDVNKS